MPGQDLSEDEIDEEDDDEDENAGRFGEGGGGGDDDDGGEEDDLDEEEEDNAEATETAEVTQGSSWCILHSLPLYNPPHH